MAILVTGGAGYIGSHTCIELLNAGFDIIIVDNFSNSKPGVLDRIKKISHKNFKFYKVDLTDSIDLEKIFKTYNIEAVIHFAGFKAVSESIEVPLAYYRNNIIGTLMLCKLMQKYKVYRIVFSSSAAVYGSNNVSPLTENMPVSANNPYGYTKLMIEQILKDFYVSDNNWSIALLRYFNPVGAHESGLIGEAPNDIPNNIMPYMTKVAKGQLPKLRIYGNDYLTVDGTGVRDYIHVMDLAEGHVAALNNLTKGVHIYNLGTGKGTSVLQLVNAFQEANGLHIPYEIVDRRPGDSAESYADVTKARLELNWTARRSITDMCRDAWRFEKEYEEHEIN